MIIGSSLGKICILTRHLNRQLITITKKLLTFGKTFTTMSFQTLKEIMIKSFIKKIICKLFSIKECQCKLPKNPNHKYFKG